MSDTYYYDIFLNDKEIATVGPSSLKQLHISFGVMDGKPIVKAGGVSDTDGLMYINWFEDMVKFTDSLKVVPSKKGVATDPLITKKLGNEAECEEESNVCDFCNQPEDEVGDLINLGGSPLICAKCIKRCVNTLESRA